MSYIYVHTFLIYIFLSIRGRRDSENSNKALNTRKKQINQLLLLPERVGSPCPE